MDLFLLLHIDLKIAGASALRLTFDRRSSLREGGAFAAFFADEGCTKVRDSVGICAGHLLRVCVCIFFVDEGCTKARERFGICAGRLASCVCVCVYCSQTRGARRGEIRELCWAPLACAFAAFFAEEGCTKVRDSVGICAGGALSGSSWATSRPTTLTRLRELNAYYLGSVFHNCVPRRRGVHDGEREIRNLCWASLACVFVYNLYLLLSTLIWDIERTMFFEHTKCVHASSKMSPFLNVSA